MRFRVAGRDTGGVESREERKARREAEGEELVALAASFKQMTADERVAQAQRTDLTDDEQLALAAFADEPDLVEALLANPALSNSARGLAKAMRRGARPWWRRRFGG